MKVQAPPPTIDFPSCEKEVAQRWDSQNIFQRSLSQNSQSKPFTFYDGPPFATGLPHFGHFVPSSIKDAFPRYFTMKGYHVPRRFGWDCHGVPVELLIQSELGLKGKADIEAYGIGRFNEACRSSVLRYTSQWEVYMKRLGRWVDMSNCYRTMDLPFMESVWAVFKVLWDKGLVYEGKQVMSYSCALGSSLSNFEASLDYRDVQDPSVTLTAPLLGAHKGHSLLVWTTTPWTLPANLAIAIDPKGHYDVVAIEGDTTRYIVLQGRFEAYFGNEPKASRVGSLIGAELANEPYEPFFDTFAQHRNGKTHRVYGVDYVLHDTGTGAVHTAPAFGEDDFQCGKRYGLPLLDHLDENGHYLPGNLDAIVGLSFKEGEKALLNHLKQRGRVFRHETLNHSYPMCYRSGQPLIFRATPSWFIKVEALKDQLMANNRNIHWVPGHLQEGRFGRWLENARDWNVGRTRFWGTPLPIWKNEETGETLCLGSVAELESHTGTPITDLHMEHIDTHTIPSPTGRGTLKRVPFVFDCWFESGSMPYAQNHYPFENKERFDSIFPADFICEGLDQTRGWFYTLHVLATALFDKPAFRNVVVNGIVLAEDGRKMSKSLKNFPDPMATLDEFGADAVRLFLLSSPATAAEEMRFSTEGVRETTRRILLPLWNAYSFFATYASLEHYDPAESPLPPLQDRAELDQWIALQLELLTASIHKAMTGYQIAKVVPLFVDFLDDLNNWYIRRSRRRFWNGDSSAFGTLYHVLVRLTQLLAPFAPFASDYLFGMLRLAPPWDAMDSVHLTQVPDGIETMAPNQKELLEKVALARRIVEMGRSLRTAHKLKNRQPLALLSVAVRDPALAQWVGPISQVLCDELNVKRVDIAADSATLAQFRVKPNFKSLGKKLGDSLKAVQQGLAQLPEPSIALLRQGGTVEVAGHTLNANDVVIDLQPRADGVVAGDADLVVALDTRLTPDLQREGAARELVSLIQKARKGAGLAVEDRILLHIEAPERLKEALRANGAYIEEETLGVLTLSAPPQPAQAHHTQVAVEGQSVGIWIQKREKGGG